MEKNGKEILKKTVKFALTVCTMLIGAALLGILPVGKRKEKHE